MTKQTTLLVMTEPGVLKGVGLDSTQPAPPNTFSASNPPWLLGPGETLRDNIKAGVPIYNATIFSPSNDVFTVLSAVEAAITTPGYVYFPHRSDNWVINILKLLATNDWRGYANIAQNGSGQTKVMGWIGDGAQDDGTGTIFCQGTAMIPSDARAYALNPTDATTPVPLQSLYLSNSHSSLPIFISGIRFRGALQGPNGVIGYSGMTVNVGVSSPIPNRGLAIWRSVVGSRIQFCCFEGFAFTNKAAPPGELAGLECNNVAELTLYSVEIKGTLPDGTLSAGGFMPNYSSSLIMTDCWIHDTRRSGFAIHEHGGGDNGGYLFTNVQVEGIADTGDAFTGSGLNQFPACNIEEANGTFRFVGCRFEAGGGYDITLATSFNGAMAQQIRVDDFVSLSPTRFNGCLVVRVIKQPNSQGINPYWTLLTNNGLGALPLLVTWKGAPLIPIASTAFNAAIHFPEKYYIVVTN